MTQTPVTENDLVLFKQCGDNIEASGLRALLDANGIYCVIQGEQHRAMLGTLGAYIEVNVMVPKSELERANRLVAEAKAEAEAESPEEEAPVDEGPPRKNRRRALAWGVIALLFGPFVVAMIAGVFQRCG